MKKLRLVISFVVLVIAIQSVKAQTQTDTVGSLKEIIVTATRKPQLTEQLPFSASAVTQKDLQQQMPRSTPEALTGVSGVFIQKTNHGGGSPFVRGLTGNQVLLLVDGIRLNNATYRFGPNQYLNTVDVFTINKIEVIRGSGSVQYGSDALGGVVQLFTKDPAFATKPTLNGNVLANYMTQDMQKILRGEVAFGSAKFAAAAGYSFKKFGDLWGGDSTGKQSPSGYGENAFDVKLRFNPATNWIIKAAHQSLLQNDVPVYHKVKLENFDINKMGRQNRHLSYIMLDKLFTGPMLNKLHLIVSHQKTGETRISQKNNSQNQIAEKDDVNTIGLNADVSHRFNNYWTANTGAELYSDKVNSLKQDRNLSTQIVKTLRGLYPDDSRYNSLSFYTLHHLQYKNWIFEGGLRYNSFSITIKDTFLGTVTTHPSAVVFNGGILRKLNGQNAVYLNYSNGFRAPNIDDMGSLGIVDFRYELPAYDLKPERSKNFELGYKFSNPKVSANAALFYNYISQLITRQKVEGAVTDGYNVYKKVNNEKAYIYGTDVELFYRITSAIDVSGNISYLLGQNITKQEPMRRIPPLNGRILLNYHTANWYAKAEYLAADKQNRLAQGDKEDNRIPLGGTPGWNIFNLYGGWYIHKFLLNAGVQNILNRDYRTHGSGINGVGRSLWVAVNFRF